MQPLVMYLEFKKFPLDVILSF